MKDYKAQGIIIRVRDYNEADRLVTIFTKEQGKIQAIAKGCRKLKSRKRGIIQLFTYADFMLYKGRNLDTITQCQAIEPFNNIVIDLLKSAYASYMLELIDAAVPVGQKHEEILYLTLICFHMLSLVDPELITHAFEIRLMETLGYRPQLERCVQCEAILGLGQVAFSSELGGSLCKECEKEANDRLFCSLGTLRMLQQLADRDIKKIDMLKPTTLINKEIRQIMKAYIGQRVEKKLKSVEFLESLQTIDF